MYNMCGQNVQKVPAISNQSFEWKFNTNNNK